MFSSALVSLSLYEYRSSLVLLISSFEAFLANIEENQNKLDRRSAKDKWQDFKNAYPNCKKDFRRYSELSEDPDNILAAALKLRNSIVHTNSKSSNAADVSNIILTAVLPLLQTVYFNTVGAELIDKLDGGLRKMFTTAFFLRTNYDLVGNDWARILSPLIWRLQYTLSPNFIPKFLYDEDGYPMDTTQEEINALHNLTHKLHFLDNDDYLQCPCCDKITIAVKYGFLETKGRETVSIEEMHCVSCNLELLSNPLDQLISETLLDTFLTEHEPRLRAEFGLK